MAGDVTHGADPDRLDAVADGMHDLGSRTKEVEGRGTLQLTVLEESWRGADLAYFISQWDAARGQIDRAGDHLFDGATALREHAEQQRRASGDSGSGGGGGPAGPVSPGGGEAGPGPTPTPTPPSPPREDPSPEPTPSPSPGPPPVPPPPREERTIDNMEDPGTDTELPKGLDGDEQWVKDMMATPEGRKTLQYLHDHGYTIDTSGNDGDRYYHSGKKIYLGESWQDGGALIHEANHAEAKVTGQTPTYDDSREDYVDGMIEEEIESNARQLEWGREHGPDQPFQSRYNRAYDTAYEDAIDSGQSPQQATAAAESAGRDEIRDFLESGDMYPTGSPDKTYRENYGEQWDENQDDGPWWWPF